MVKVLIADSHVLSREGIKSLLGRHDDLKLAGVVNESSGLLPCIGSTGPDVIIIDYNITGFFNIGDLKSIQDNFPGTGVLVITSNPNRAEILKALDFGVCGYLLKECDETEITNAIRSTARNEKFFCGKVLDILLDKSTGTLVQESEKDSCQPVIFSNREMEVIKLIAKGYTTKTIADKLFLSFHTVATHRKNILKKADIRNSSELILYALNRGIISSYQN
jgi:DNA-binding NarL/FixJ family response regulator